MAMSQLLISASVISDAPSGASGVDARLNVDAVDFDEFVMTQAPSLVRLARGLLKNPHDAEDVVQDVLAKALLKWGTICAADHPEAYVRRMVVNACTSFFRRPSRREAPTEFATPSFGMRMVRADATEELAQRDRMMTLIRRLPTKQRAVLVLRHYEDRSDADIADLLGCSQVTVRSNAMRGLATLRRWMEEES